MKLLVANWKMNKDWSSTVSYIDDLNHKLLEVALKQHPKLSDVKIIIAPPYPFLKYISNQNYRVAAQNCFSEEKGSFTGEVSVKMLNSIGVEYVILGHSERRKYFNETDEDIFKKLELVLKNKLIPIFCCGETEKSRKKSEHFIYIKNQLYNSLNNLDPNLVKNIIVAYEPIWAIGSNVTPSLQEIQEMHCYIKDYIYNLFGENVSQEIKIIYGGNLNPNNAKSIFQIPEVYGGLVGRASLVVDDFIEILMSYV